MRVLGQRYSALDYYLYTSIIAATVLWFGKYIDQGVAVFDNFFLCLFMLGSYSYFVRGVGQKFFLNSPRIACSIFLFQIVSLVGMSFVEGVVGGIYLTIVPLSMAYLFFAQRENPEGKGILQRGVAFFAIVPLTLIIGESFVDGGLVSGQRGVYLFAFMFWSLATLLTSQGSAKKDRLSLFGSLLQAGDNNTHPIGAGRVKKDRLFFHDIINQTHGINLYLSGRISRGEGLNPSECNSLMNEVRVIQTLIKDHFKFGHKNLTQSYDYVTFAYAKDGVEQLIHSFLPEYVVQCHFEYNGFVAYDAPIESQERAMIHYSAFTRILTNLVKNISEVKAQEVFFHFDYDQSGLSIVVKNRVLNQDSSVFELEKKLAHLILHDEAHEVLKRDSGLGLESVTRLCREHGGEFKFFLEDDFWVNEVFLPGPAIEERKAA